MAKVHDSAAKIIDAVSQARLNQRSVTEQATSAVIAKTWLTEHGFLS